MRIYIMGSTGSGKTYLSKILSEKYNIKSYELDRIVYDQNNLNIKRNDDDIKKDFEKIISTDSWIIEDIGRKRFSKGRELADKIYYIKISLIKNYYQMIKRWLRERKGIENYKIKPTYKNLLKELKDIRLYQNFEKELFEELENYKNKIVIVRDKDEVNL